jgi:mono/diheme cytochrome c family protein
LEALRHLGVVATVAIFLAGCAAPHGRPREGAEVLAPNEISDFGTVFSENCAGCHGLEGKGGAAIALANPVYLAIADDPSIRKIIAKGISGTAMPAFAQSAGGMLTDAQIDVIVQGIRSRWGQQGILGAVSVPPYAARLNADGQRGETTYKTFCESCHGPGGRGGKTASAITNDSFLALLDDQSLRTIVIAGRPELGAPDWRGNAPGTPMSDQDVTDVVAWLASRRAQNPGQPYSASNTSQSQESEGVKRK